MPLGYTCLGLGSRIRKLAHAPAGGLPNFSIAGEREIAMYFYTCRVCQREFIPEFVKKRPRQFCSKLCMNRNRRGELRRKLWESLASIGFKICCSCCGTDNKIFLNIDHVRNNGAQERKEISNTHRFHRRIIEHPGDYQILCWNCNMAKFLLGTCPHKDEFAEYANKKPANHPMVW